MKKLKVIYKNFKIYIINFIILLLISSSVLSNDISFEIQGNDYTDYDVILSLLDEIPSNLDDQYSNQIIKALNESNLFEDVAVEFINNTYFIKVKEFPTINKIYFNNNERLKDDDLHSIASAINLNTLNSNSINIFINEIKKVYVSFGYNNINIEYTEKINDNTNTADIFFDIYEGTLTKINKIIINGNKSILDQEVKEIISSKTKTIRNIFINNNFKPNKIEKDKILIINYYRNIGFLDIKVEAKVEYLNSNKVNIYFNITEGEVYLLSSIKALDKDNILSNNTVELINNEIYNYQNKESIFSINQIQQLRRKVSSIIIDSGIDYFEIKTFDQVVNNKVDLILEIVQISPKYTKQINIVGNTRTYDYVIRRELEIAEGDAIYDNQLKNIRDKIISLNLFEEVVVKEEIIDSNNVNLIIEVKEKQTGTFNAGVSVGTLDGFAVVTGLRESNFYGTGRSLDALINTSEDKNQFKLVTTDRLSYENDADIRYSINYKQQDFSKSSSYNLDTFSSGIGIGYKINKTLYHDVDIEYVLKDYKITNSSSVSNSILNSSGGNISFLLKNTLRYSTLNPGFITKQGTFISFNNAIETPTSSSNGFVKNILTAKKFFNNSKNIFAIQTKLGNIFSLNNNDILTDDKFSLGGRWLRGFDNYGVGPRDSRTSYTGGNNVAVTKLDYSFEITRDSDFPVYLNVFNDYGLIWDNKTQPTYNDNNLRSSAGFGVRYYSPIGPIGFSWGFPIIDEEYDIKRMFLFSIGNLD